MGRVHVQSKYFFLCERVTLLVRSRLPGCLTSEVLVLELLADLSSGWGAESARVLRPLHPGDCPLLSLSSGLGQALFREMGIIHLEAIAKHHRLGGS